MEPLRWPVDSHPPPSSCAPPAVLCTLQIPNCYTHWAKRIAAAVVLLLTVLTACSPAEARGPDGPLAYAPTAALSAASTPTSGYPVKVYFSKHPASDSNPTAVFAVSHVSPTLGVAAFATHQLIIGPTASERAAGYYSGLTGTLSGASHCGGADFRIALNLRGTRPESGTATLQFCRTVAIPGELAGARMTAEIENTLRQFATITNVVILTQGCLSAYGVKVSMSRQPASDNDPTEVQAVGRLSPTLGVATYSIQQLISGPLPAERDRSYYTPLTGALSGASNCGGADFSIALNHKGSSYHPGTATLRFCRAVALAGDLTGARISAEITATLRQFATISTVVILDRTGTCFDDLSGQNLCLK
jgi:hypothetical protein